MSALLEDTRPGYPLLPHLDDSRWRAAIVRPKRQESTELRDLPRDKASETLTTVYSGDTVYIIRDIHYHSWVAAKVGYKIGWLNSWHIDLTMARWLNPEPETTWVQESQETIPQELLISQIESLNEALDPETEIRLSKREVSRIIGYLKGIAHTLRGAKERHS